ncbi:MAG TPA: ClbS/DfsB family four-helix bundle protein [Anaerolineales bacterium]|nr:ClbS/DfsB family four-helix bundle protein [Anaerolineales bacterium]
METRLVEDKHELLKLLQGERDRWEALLADFGTSHVGAPTLPSYYSVKDIIAHLMAWQQITVARLEAAQQQSEPVIPDWLHGLDLDADEAVDQVNDRIYTRYQNQPWPSVYRAWQTTYQRVLDLAQEIPASDLFKTGKYPWLGDYRLADVLEGTYHHHHEEHLEPLLAWLQARNNPGGV